MATKKPGTRKAATKKSSAKTTTSAKKKLVNKAMSSPKKKPAATKVVAKKKPAATKVAAKKKPAAAKAVAKKKTTATKVAAKKKPAAAKAVAKKKPATTKKKPVTTTTTKTTVAKKKVGTVKKPTTNQKPATNRRATVTKLTKKAVTSRKQPTVTQTLTNKKGATLSETIQSLRSSSTDLSHLMDIEPYQPEAGEEYMNDQQREHFVAILQSWKASLMQEVDRTVTHMKDEAANFPDITDRATQEEEFNLELRTRDRERKLIKKIDEALERIREHEFGYCDACGVEIGIRRLEARPTATLCIDCKTLAEIKEKQTFS